MLALFAAKTLWEPGAENGDVERNLVLLLLLGEVPGEKPLTLDVDNPAVAGPVLGGEPIGPKSTLGEPFELLAAVRRGLLTGNGAGDGDPSFSGRFATEAVGLSSVVVVALEGPDSASFGPDGVVGEPRAGAEASLTSSSRTPMKSVSFKGGAGALGEMVALSAMRERPGRVGAVVPVRS